MADVADEPPPPSAAGDAVADDRVFLVPLGWWREAEEGLEEEENGVRGIPYLAAHSSSSYYGIKLINNIFSSDLGFSLRRDGEAWENGVEAAASGRCYALLPADLWSMAIKRHTELKSVKNNGQQSFSHNDVVDVYPLMLRISVQRETSVLTVKISKKDNPIDHFKRASKIFAVDTEPVRIWDFSGQTNLIVMNEWNRLPQDCHQKTEQEILLEVQVYGLLDNNNSGSDSLKQSKINHYGGSSLGSNGSIGNLGSDFLKGSFKGGPLGLLGLENLGNTCFMNSAVQCLTHTPHLVDFFLGDYSNEINHQNPLGLKGELAVAFGDLLRLLWAADRTPVVPRAFKTKLSRFAPQFSGFSQHDSQELLAFLLDGLHEDLNRVKCKPYTEVKDAAGRPDEEVADEYWGNHLARNNSIIVDICQGQYKSTLLCPVCQEMSVTFDPFMYLSLPLPSTTTRAMTVTVFSTDGFAGPSAHTVNVPKLGKLKDLIQALSNACSLRDDENLLIAEVFSNRIIRFLEEPSDSITLIRDEDRLVAYRIPKDLKQSPLVVFVHQKLEENFFLGKRTSTWKGFGVPLMTLLPNDGDGSTICKLFMKIVSPFKKLQDTGICDNQNKYPEDPGEVAHETEGCSSSSETAVEAIEDDEYAVGDFEFYMTDEKCQTMQSKIEMNEPLPLTGIQKHLYILVSWQNKALEQCDISLLNTLPDVYKFRSFSKKTQESFSLYACLEAFLKEEPLGPDDMWYCPSCKKHQQASKKLDLWRLPEVLVIHLKRFTYSRYLKTKLETYVDFPIHDLDLSTYVSGTSTQSSNHYRLYAISNHYGNMGGGHYTAYAYHEGENCWYNFDDQNVHSLAEESIKTSAAYVLFYRRIQNA